MNPKVVMGLAIVAGLVAVLLVQRHVSNLQGEVITVFKAADDQKAGKNLGSKIEEVSIPSGLFPNLLSEAPTAELVEFVRTTPLRESVRAGDILLFRHFDSAADRGVLAEIPRGMKAISIPVSQVTAVSFFVQPGDFVDVIGTFLGNQQSAESRINNKAFDVSTRPILQAVQVLAVGEQHRRSDRQLNEPYSSVTLLVTMEQAAKLIFARDFFGVSMTLVLRGEGDIEIGQDIPGVGIGTANFDQIGNSPASAPE